MGLQGQGDRLPFEELLTLGPTQFPRLWHPKVLCGRIGKLWVFLPQGTLGLNALGPVRKLLLYAAQPGHQTQPLLDHFYKKSPTDNVSWFLVAFTADLWSTGRGHSAHDLPLVSPWLDLSPDLFLPLPLIEEADSSSDPTLMLLEVFTSTPSSYLDIFPKEIWNIILFPSCYMLYKDV